MKNLKEEFVNGSTFHRVLWDDAESGNSSTKLKPDAEIRRVVICSGKIYFDLLEERYNRSISDIYILRLEQYYPFPAMSFIRNQAGSKMLILFGARKNQKTREPGHSLNRIQNGPSVGLRQNAKGQSMQEDLQPPLQQLDWLHSTKNNKA